MMTIDGMAAARARIWVDGFRSGGRRLVVALAWGLGLVSTLLLPGLAAASQNPSSSVVFEQLASGALKARPSLFKICENQAYALCAAAKCTMYNEVAYCRCDVERGDSISLPLRLSPTEDVCDVNAEGVTNGYMVSTFSVPKEVEKPRGDRALYTCPSSSTGAYAQCDGGICFKSTRGQNFPGFDETLANDEIICSCPATVPDPSEAKVGFQIVGPFPCRSDFFRNCQSASANTDTGSTIYVGAPTGVPELLTLLLNGRPSLINRCRAQ